MIGMAMVPSATEPNRTVDSDPADAVTSVPEVRNSTTFTVSSPGANRPSGVSEEGE